MSTKITLSIPVGETHTLTAVLVTDVSDGSVSNPKQVSTVYADAGLKKPQTLPLQVTNGTHVYFRNLNAGNVVTAATRNEDDSRRFVEPYTLS